MWRLILSTLLLTSCSHKRVVRDASVYKVEISFIDLAFQKSSFLLRTFLQDHCSCAQGQWSNPTCQETAKTLVILETRMPYHLGMMLFNAGLRDSPGEAPDIPNPALLCPPESGSRL